MLQRARELSLTVGEAELEARIEEIRKDYSDGSFNALFGNGGINYPAWKEALRKRMLLEKVIAAGCECKDPGDGRRRRSAITRPTARPTPRSGGCAPRRSSSATGTGRRRS